MKVNRVSVFWLLLSFAMLFAVVLLFQSRAAGLGDIARPVHISTDWSTRHLIYSGEPTGPNARLAMQDPRYLRHLSIYGNLRSLADERDGVNDWHLLRGPGPIRRPEESPMKRDWQLDLGADATLGPFNFASHGYSYPAKFSFNINAAPSCPLDFVVFPTGVTGVTHGQPSIVALNQLYSGSGGACGTGQPTVMWAYNTNLSGDTDGMILSSPVLSIDGSKVAFVETNSTSGSAILKILKWVSTQGTISNAVAPTAITTGQPWSTCPTTGTSCLFSLSFSGGATDTYSSPFYDYNNDTLYVGDDNGLLHKFTGVFYGTPTEVTTGGVWPIAVASTVNLTGPVFDAVSGNIFVADISTSLHYIRETGSTVGACASGSPPCIGTPSLTVSNNSFQGVFDPPIVDINSHHVFVFSTLDPTGSNNVVYQATTSLNSSVEVSLGTAFNFSYSGAFDKNYHTGNYGSGFLYACGTHPPTLYRIGFNSSGVMNSTPAPGSVSLGESGTFQNCISMTEIVNSTHDYLFFGMPAEGAATNCGGGCVMGLDLATMTWPPSISTFSSLAVPNGPSAIVVDNVGTGGQESSIYFGPGQGNNCTAQNGDGCA